MPPQNRYPVPNPCILGCCLIWQRTEGKGKEEERREQRKGKGTERKRKGKGLCRSD